MRISDWSSDVCSSDLVLERGRVELLQRRRRVGLLQAQSLEFALEQFASVLDVARAIELVEPRAHLLARTRAGEESVGRHQQVATRFGHLAGEDLDTAAPFRPAELRVGNEVVKTCKT